MNEEILEELWSSLHENIELVELLFDSQDKVIEEAALESIQMELENNLYIQDTIVEHVKQRRTGKGEYDLSGLDYEKPAAVIKYLSHCSDTLKVNLSDSDTLKKEFLDHLADELACRHICVEELNLSKLKAMDDAVLE